ncbi:MAG: glycosyltransferase family 29 protein [Deferribacteraceae bacterium]|nr:glycosyltransferase family 29 protein [Deferribacteraceae bacterium]
MYDNMHNTAITQLCLDNSDMILRKTLPRPSSGVHMIWKIWHCTKALDAYGFSFLQEDSTQPYSHYFQDAGLQSNVASKPCPHNFAAESKFLRALLQKEQIS